ncbi:alpha/beta hydrolase [Nocardiopsis gilva YIM 90087]|uniref:Alpha/beta hydrolase n=1 Tax=Nocardiopsis gilva YIM 90087 TaxID=1235441 RepID=A0A223S4N8_9ACTN|nr:alpha/beta fold hydrolase [Nocardiopsis gilva]ASU83100.1 alpha/beta hydrolase [Nocardiopsis gilva YIM 90087]
MPSPSPVALTRAAAGALAALLLATGCGVSPDRPAEPDPPGVEPAERDVRFDSGPDTLHGTFALPRVVGDAPIPAALIISGSGPTDRDGNSELRPGADTNLNLARVLAEAGVASLRYDKLGSGTTGLGSHDAEEPVPYEVFEDEMADAYAELIAQPEVDPGRVLVVGHSEGALFALRSPEVVAEHPPVGLVLAAPVGDRYLDTLDRQITEQVRTAETAQQIGATDATDVLSKLRTGIARIRADKPLPQEVPAPLSHILTTANAPFLRTIDAMDPVELARDLPPETRTLVLWGTADTQIAEEDVDRLMGGLDNARRVDLPDADHVLRLYDDSPGVSVLDADREFSPEVAPAVREFLDGVV